MFSGLRFALERLNLSGTLIVVDAKGQRSTFGRGGDHAVQIRFTDTATERKIAFDPTLAFPEAFIAGRMQIEQGTVYELLELLMKAEASHGLPNWTKVLAGLRMAFRRWSQFNPATQAKRNVAHHYDIDGSIYDLFLDKDRQYSCGYFTPGTDLEEAQLAKKRHLAAKLAIEPGQSVLDIGSGWGGLALYLAHTADADVTGVTLSNEQLALARDRARTEGLEHRVQFHLQDYRQIRRKFDRIVSVGMFEHVGINHYRAYFNAVREMLNDDGVAVIHAIGRSDGPGYTNPFIARYIFPGGYFPALSEVLPAVETSGLIVSDIEILRLHYAETLKAWRERFLAHRQRAVELKGEPFARMWEFYLAGSEVGFRHQGLVVFQLQVVKAIDALPITRDYITARERQLALAERSGTAGPLAAE